MALPIPGQRDGPEALDRALPHGYRLHEQKLLCPDDSFVHFGALPADDEFVPLFAGGCVRAPTEENCRQIEQYTVNACISGHGGSFDAARCMMSINEPQSV